MRRIVFFFIVFSLHVVNVSASNMPVPTEQQAFTYEALPDPIVNSSPDLAKPVGIGDTVAARQTINLHISLGQFDGPVDVFLGLYAPGVSPDIVIFHDDQTLAPLSSGLVQWRKNVTGAIDEAWSTSVTSTNPLPPGTYYVYVLVTPPNDPNRFYLFIASFAVPPDQMASPTGHDIFTQDPTDTPLASTLASQALPIGVGSVITGGPNMTVRVGLPEFSGPVDIYLGMYFPAIDPNNVYLMNQFKEVSPLSSGLVKWKENQTASILERILPEIPLTVLPPGNYAFYLVVTPAGSTDKYYLWTSELSSTTLSISKFGDGLVTSDVPGIQCGEDCSNPYPPSTTVVLTATPESDSVLRSWSGCDSVDGSKCVVTVNGNVTVAPTFAYKETILSPAARLLSDSTMAHLVRIEGPTYYFDAAVPQISELQIGDVIISTTGNGFLRRIQSISRASGGVVAIDTEDATLDDVVEQGSFILSGESVAMDLKSVKLADGVRVQSVLRQPQAQVSFDIDKNFSVGGASVKLAGSTTLNFNPDFALSFKKVFGVPYGVKNFRAALKVDNASDLTVTIEGSVGIHKKVPIAVVPFAPVAVGPLVLVPEATVYVGVDAGADAAVTTGVTVGFSSRVGVEYKKGKWHGIGNFQPTFDYIPPTVNANAFVQGYVSPEFSIKVYNVAGPFANLKGYLDLESTVNPPSWGLAGGIRACVGAKLEILSISLGRYETCPFNLTKQLATGQLGGVLDVSPRNDFTIQGPAGGPFLSQYAFTLKNTGMIAPIDWTVSTSNNWLSVRDSIGAASVTAVATASDFRAQAAASGALSLQRLTTALAAPGGTLLPGESTTVVVSVADAARDLPPGTYTNSVTFSNTTNSAGNTSAKFVLTVLSDQRLSVNKSGNGSGTVTGSGINCGTVCSEDLANGTAVTLTAIADNGSTFMGWSGCDSVNANTCTVTMSQNKTVTAIFALQLFALSVQKSGNGSGTVTGSGINCGTVCSEDLDNGTAVILMANPDGGSVFTGWSGCDGTDGYTCMVTMNQNKTVTVTFTAASSAYTLTVLNPIKEPPPGSGVVTGSHINCPSGSQCSASYAGGALETLTATPNSGSALTGWSGCDSVNGNTCRVTMNQDKTVIAFFGPGQSTFSVQKEGTGSGTVTGSGINCGSVCSEDVASGSTVTLTATPNIGSAFTGWLGCDSVNENTCTVTVNQNKTVIAIFISSASTYTLGLKFTTHAYQMPYPFPPDGFTVTSSPPGIDCTTARGQYGGELVGTCSSTYTYGTQVTLTITPNTIGYVFSGWLGCDSTNGNACTVTLSQDKVVTVYIDPNG